MHLYDHEIEQLDAIFTASKTGNYTTDTRVVWINPIPLTPEETYCVGRVRCGFTASNGHRVFEASPFPGAWVGVDEFHIIRVFRD